MLQHLFAFIKNQFHTCVKIVRSDKAEELFEGNVLAIYNTLGIQHQKSCTYTPQQNGVVERKHKHFLETARALFFQSNLPHSFWEECVLCAAYLINRLPLSCLQNKSPYEKLFGTIPNNNNPLRAFGCLCYVSTIKPRRTKFEARGNPCVFIGYPYAQKAYKAYD